MINLDALSLNNLDLDPANGIATPAPADSTVIRFTPGTSVDDSANYETQVILWGNGSGDITGLGTTYVGVRFQDASAKNHYGWLRFNFPESTPDNGILEAAAWESQPDTAITIPAPVPEPAATGAMFALALGGWAVWRRRQAKS